MQRQCQLEHCISQEPSSPTCMWIRTMGSTLCSPMMDTSGHFSKVTALYSSEDCNCRAEGTQLLPTKQVAWKQRVSSPQNCESLLKRQNSSWYVYTYRDSAQTCHMSKHMDSAICTHEYTHASFRVCVYVSLCQHQISGRQLLLPLPHKQQALLLPSADFTPFPCLAFLPASKHALSLPTQSCSLPTSYTSAF